MTNFVLLFAFPLLELGEGALDLTGGGGGAGGGPVAGRTGVVLWRRAGVLTHATI